MESTENGEGATDEKKQNNLSKLEETVRTQSKRKQIETAILGGITITGFMAVALLAPNTVQVLRKALPDLRPVNQKQSVKRAIGRLIKNKYLQKQHNKYVITVEGEEYLQRLLLRSQGRNFAKRKKKWDKKWRIVVFDIKESEKNKRDDLRNMLVETGFVKLQDSVWVYPFRCDEVVALLKFSLKLGRGAVYIIADAIEGDEWLRKHFNLPQNEG